MQTIIERNQQLYGLRNLTYQEFLAVMESFGSIDERCALDEETLEQLYQVLVQKQNGEVTYASVEVLVFEFLIQQPVQLTAIREEELGPLSRKLPRSMMSQVDSELLKNLINFHKVCQSKLNINYTDSIAYSRLEQIGKALQNSLHLDTEPLLRYFSVLQDEHQIINNAEILQLINELERAVYQTQKERVSLRASFRPSQQMQQKQQITDTQADILNFSSDEEKASSRRESKESEEQVTLNSHQKLQHYSSQILKGLDYLRQQRAIAKVPDGPRIVSDLMKLVQRIEVKALEFYTWNEEKARLIEELYLERELVQSKLNSEEEQKRVKGEQIRQMLEDNDILYAEISHKETLVTRLQDQIEKLLEQSQSQSMLESEARSRQLEIERITRKLNEQEQESKRLQQNNKVLLDILSQYESQQQPQEVREDQKPADTHSWQIDELTSTNKVLEDKLVDRDEQLRLLSTLITKLEGQLQDAKREGVHYKNLYETSRDDNMQLRNSIMRPSMTLAGMGRQSTLATGRISNLGMYRFERTSNLGRISQLNRISNINPGRSPLLADIHRQDSLEDGKPQLNEIKEEEETVEQQQQEPQTLSIPVPQPRATETKQVTVQLGMNFSDFWDRYVQPEAGTYKPGYNPEYKFLEFDENVLYEKDYLGLRDEKKVLDILKVERSKYNQQLIRCFSDAIFRIDGKGQRQRRVLLCTEFTMYVFESEKNFKITRQFPIDKITQVIFSETSPILCCFSIKGTDDYLIETFKRSALNVYLSEVLTSRNLPLYDLQFKTSFMVRFQSFRHPKKIEDIAKGLYMGGSKQAVYKVSDKMGMMQMFSKKWIGKEWQDVFVLLCDVGLILFKKLGDLEPLLFVPLAEALVIKNPKAVDRQRPNMIKICYQTMDQEILFCTKSPAETDEWHDLIHNAINNRYKLQSKNNFAERSEIESQRSTIEQK